MTCIAAIEDGERVWLAADTRVSGEDGWNDNTHGKVWRHAPGIAFGVAGAANLMQLVRYRLRAPRRQPGMDAMRWCITRLVPSLKRVLKEEPRDENGQLDFEMAVAIDGKVFLIDAALTVLQAPRGYTAIGCGRDIALGSLFSTKRQSPKARVCKAVEAACTHNNACALPLEVICVS